MFIRMIEIDGVKENVTIAHRRGRGGPLGARRPGHLHRRPPRARGGTLRQDLPSGETHLGHRPRRQGGGYQLDAQRGHERDRPRHGLLTASPPTKNALWPWGWTRFVVGRIPHPGTTTRIDPATSLGVGVAGGIQLGAIRRRDASFSTAFGGNQDPRLGLAPPRETI